MILTAKTLHKSHRIQAELFSRGIIKVGSVDDRVPCFFSIFKQGDKWCYGQRFYSLLGKGTISFKKFKHNLSVTNLIQEQIVFEQCSDEIKIGDTVKLKYGLEIGKDYGNVTFQDLMLDYLAKEFEVADIVNYKGVMLYRFKDDIVFFSKEMLNKK